MKRFVPLLLTAIMLCASVASAEYVFCTPDTYVNVRTSPSGGAVGWLECGTEISTNGKTKRYNGKTWAHAIDLNAEDSDGWVCIDFLSDTPVHVETRTAYAVAIGKLAVRKSPTQKGKVKAWLQNGDKCTVLADNGEWAITTRGYVMMEFLEFVEVAEDE